MPWLPEELQKWKRDDALSTDVPVRENLIFLVESPLVSLQQATGQRGCKQHDKAPNASFSLAVSSCSPDIRKMSYKLGPGSG